MSSEPEHPVSPNPPRNSPAGFARQHDTTAEDLQVVRPFTMSNATSTPPDDRRASENEDRPTRTESPPAARSGEDLPRCPEIPSPKSSSSKVEMVKVTLRQFGRGHPALHEVLAFAQAWLAFHGMAVSVHDRPVQVRIGRKRAKPNHARPASRRHVDTAITTVDAAAEMTTDPAQAYFDFAGAQSAPPVSVHNIAVA